MTTKSTKKKTETKWTVKPVVLRGQDELFAWDVFAANVAGGGWSPAEVAKRADQLLLLRRERTERSRCDHTVGGTSRGKRCSLKLGHQGQCK